MKARGLPLLCTVAFIYACIPQTLYNQEVQQNRHLLYLNGTDQQLSPLTGISLLPARSLLCDIWNLKGLTQISSRQWPFGRYHPIASNDSFGGRAQNRRINIVIRDQTP